MSIPVRNLYFMLCYAWDRLEEAESIPVGVESTTDIKDLLARILINGTRRCLKEGLDGGYLETEVVVAGIRGRLKVSDSIAQGRMLLGRNVCDVDEFTPNTLANQILKTTLWRLSRVSELNANLKRAISEVLARMGAVSVRHHLSRHDFQKIQLHGNNRLYRFLLNICEIVLNDVLVEQGEGTYLFKDFIQNEQRMRQVFQDFVFNFLKRHQTHFSVARDRFHWDTDALPDASRGWLPMMETDITLRSQDRVVVIDTKFSKHTLQSNFGKQSVRSDHLYQIFSYLKNLERRGPPYDTAEGILLYPVVNQEVNLSFPLPGHHVSVQTIDLRLPSQQLSESLLRITCNVAVTNGNC